MPILSGQHFPITVRKTIYFYLVGISHVPACVHCLLFCYCSSLRRVWLPSLTQLLRDYIQWDLFLAFSLLKCGETMLPELSLLVLCSSPQTSSVTFHWNCCSALVRRSTKMDDILQTVSHNRWVKRNNNFPQCWLPACWLWAAGESWVRVF